MKAPDVKTHKIMDVPIILPDIGTIRQGTLEVVVDKIDPRAIRVVAEPPWNPGWVFSSKNGLDPAIVAAVGTALLALDIRYSDQQAILDAAQIAGAIASTDTDYDAVRQAVRQVEGALNQ